MNDPHHDSACMAFRDQLLQLACSDVATPSDGLQAHLAACPACREHYAECRTATVALRVALTPDPLPRALDQSIRASIALRARRAAPRRIGPLPIGGLLAAACVAGAILIPGYTLRDEPVAQRNAVLALSEEDAKAIVSTWALLRWDSSVDYAAQSMWTALQNVQHTLQRDAESDTALPWSTEDDWDLPSAAPHGTTRREQSLTSAVRRSPTAGRAPRRDGGIL